MNSKPGRVVPNTAVTVCPARSPGARIVAVACDMVRPRRSTATSISSGPDGTCATNTVFTVRNCSCGWSSSAIIARSATTVVIPPCGLTGAFQSSLNSAT
ncbi:MAG TPA: hypothetical protein VFW74_00275 [Acidimicrobiia bacterium]|nr:hypothetical protein [Acidimicrobiia bacterium]